MTPNLESRIYGCWLGKSIGGTLGLPAEGRAERLDFTFYSPVPKTAPPNDDLELQLVWLHLLESHGFHLAQSDFANGWLTHIHYMWDEYGRCRWNLRRGVPLSNVGTFENPFHAGMGAPIRSEVWACICSGNANLAARYAALDASLDHGTEGIAGEVFLAVLQNLVLSGTDVTAALTRALRGIPPGTETARAIALVCDLYSQGVETWRCRERLLAAHGHENFTHAPLNVALIAWALLYGKGDFENSILFAVNGGYDTDCTAATVGATLGLALGAERIPARWKKPIGEKVAVGNGILDICAPQTLSEMSRRTLCLVERCRKLQVRIHGVSKPKRRVSLRRLPGTITINDVPWANGELPSAVKRAGGGTWTWEVGRRVGAPHYLICLARRGARLWLDKELVVDCPAGQPYIPATHRCPSPARALFTPTKARHHIRLQLGSRSVTQDASVLLASGNLHLAAWSAETLPHPARLPLTNK
jgi:ADP-ribosylglycohydrolase